VSISPDGSFIALERPLRTGSGYILSMVPGDSVQDGHCEYKKRSQPSEYQGDEISADSGRLFILANAPEKFSYSTSRGWCPTANHAGK